MAAFGTDAGLMGSNNAKTAGAARDSVNHSSVGSTAGRVLHLQFRPWIEPQEIVTIAWNVRIRWNWYAKSIYMYLIYLWKILRSQVAVGIL
jgi:hypothetical protein